MLKETSVVTDSTASIPPSLAQEKNIDVVPALITFGNITYRDGVDLEMQKFMEMLKEASVLPTTAAPSPQEFITCYKRHPGGIVSVHAGSAFSALHSVAKTAAKEIGGRVNVVDSGTTTLALGFMVMRAADLAMQGTTPDQILDELENMKGRTTVMAAFDTLEYAKKGGRISYLEAQLGSLIQIKPILEIKDNKIGVIERPRTRNKSLDRIVELTEALGPLEQVGVLHADTPQVAENIAGQIRRFHQGDIMIGNICPALTIHGGPGIIGVAAVKKQ